MAQATGAVLLVEDDDAAREIFELALGRVGHTVHTARSGAGALTLLRSESFDSTTGAA